MQAFLMEALKYGQEPDPDVVSPKRWQKVAFDNGQTLVHIPMPSNDLDVACRFCKAKPGRHCRSNSGAYSDGRVHDERRAALEAAQAAVVSTMFNIGGYRREPDEDVD